MWHGTTILSVRKEKEAILIGDGQVTMGSMVVKHKTNKIKRIKSKNGDLVCGFAGKTADATALINRLENKINKYSNTRRACSELAKEWQNDVYLRALEAMIIVSDKKESLLVNGNGDVLLPDDNVLGIGSGSSYAVAAAKALYDTDLSATEIALKSMRIASEICVYTNDRTVMEKIDV